jgi:hypothetical protein
MNSITKPTPFMGRFPDAKTSTSKMQMPPLLNCATNTQLNRCVKNNNFTNAAQLFHTIQKHDALSSNNLLHQIVFSASKHINQASPTAIFFATLFNDCNLIQQLVAKGASPNTQTTTAWMAVHLARNTHADNLILKRYKAITNRVSKFTPLHLAAAKQGQETLETLIDHGADVHLADSFGWTALHFAAERGHTDMVSFLVSTHGLCANSVDIYNNTPLHFAAEFGHTDTINALIKQKSNINAINNHGQTALHLAAEMNHSNAVLALLQANACPDIKNKFGETALHLAAENGLINVISPLVNQGAPIHAITNVAWKKQTALQLAAENGHTEIIETLRLHGAT